MYINFDIQLHSVRNTSACRYT